MLFSNSEEWIMEAYDFWDKWSNSTPFKYYPWAPNLGAVRDKLDLCAEPEFMHRFLRQ
jgi:hypothetical protein